MLASCEECYGVCPGSGSELVLQLFYNHWEVELGRSELQLIVFAICHHASSHIAFKALPGVVAESVEHGSRGFEPKVESNQ